MVDTSNQSVPEMAIDVVFVHLYLLKYMGRSATICSSKVAQKTQHSYLVQTYPCD